MGTTNLDTLSLSEDLNITDDAVVGDDMSVWWDLTVTGAINLATGAISSDDIADSVIQVATTTIATADVLTLNATPVELVPAPGAGKAIIVDRIIGSVDFESAAYATNTTIELKTGTSGTKVTADMASLLTATADAVQTVGGIEAELAMDINESIVAQVATGNPATGDSDIKLTVIYRVVTL